MTLTQAAQGAAKTAAAPVQPEAEDQPEELSEKALLRRLVDLTEVQAASLSQWKTEREEMLTSLQHIEKAAHFLELRSDARAALLSDERRHRSHEAVEEAALAAETCSTAEKKVKKEALRESQRLRQLDRAVALLSGSCWGPLLLCLKCGRQARKWPDEPSQHSGPHRQRGQTWLPEH